jgi:hypothetical protein
MAESYAIFKRNWNNKPKLTTLEQFCFDARTRGADGDTEVSVSSGGYGTDSWGSFEVKIPEEKATATYSAPKAWMPEVKRGVPIWAVLVLGLMFLALGVIL